MSSLSILPVCTLRQAGGVGEEKRGREARDAVPLEPSLPLGADVYVTLGKSR